MPTGDDLLQSRHNRKVHLMEIRLLNPEADYPVVAELLSLYRGEPVSAAQLHEWDKVAPQDRIYEAAVAIEGDVVGFGSVARVPWLPPGQFGWTLIVDPDFRRWGIGSALADWLEERGAAHDAQVYETLVRDDEEESLEFAEKRGFRRINHIFDSRIELKYFDESRFAGLIEEVEASGIRFASLAQLGATEENLRKLHAVNRQAVLDMPGDTPFPDFDAFREMITTAEWWDAAGQIMALDGDAVVGLAAVTYRPETNTMHNNITGVLPAYRGRKIAQALKLLTIRLAKLRGAALIFTANHSVNEAMLAINRKLGYLPLAGYYVVSRRVNPADAE